ncbi:MAG: arginine deiminase-related protein [Ignavibacteria bacterium]
MPSQITSSILMVSPESFAYNLQTAGSNTFQNKPGYDAVTLRTKALEEFNGMTKKLISEGIDVYVVGNDTEFDVPDAVFPNNWFATYEDGTVMLFPMLSENRRLERDKDMLEEVFKSSDFDIKRFIDYSEYEKQGLILEGTGSLVLDRKNNAVFAIESERTNKILFDRYCDEMKIPISNRIFFHANDEQGNPIYHTNVIMSIGDGFAVICTECINIGERKEVLSKLESLRLEVIEITFFQLKNFCGNILNVKNNKGESLIVLSSSAMWNFEEHQVYTLQKYGRLVEVSINTIETVGGGSSRCMMAEIFLPSV